MRQIFGAIRPLLGADSCRCVFRPGIAAAPVRGLVHRAKQGLTDSNLIAT
jgi:hypothetical protein